MNKKTGDYLAEKKGHLLITVYTFALNNNILDTNVFVNWQLGHLSYIHLQLQSKIYTSYLSTLPSDQ